MNYNWQNVPYPHSFWLFRHILCVPTRRTFSSVLFNNKTKPLGPVVVLIFWVVGLQFHGFKSIKKPSVLGSLRFQFQFIFGSVFLTSLESVPGFFFPSSLWSRKTFQHSNSAKFKLPTTSYKKGCKAKTQKDDHLGFTLVSHHQKTRTIYIIINVGNRENNFSSYSLYKEASQKCSKLAPSTFCPDS
jgi:hypothetical protein